LDKDAKIMPEVASEGKIIIKGARVNNLKSVNLTLERDQLIVITGLSGSGKSSLAFDTIYAEGQRRYVESLSAYARQFLGRIQKPEVDVIKGLPPAIAISQKQGAHNPRSTVGTTTEVYDYLKLLYARIGKTYSPVSGKLVKKHSVTDVVDFILQQPEGTRLILASPLPFYGQKDLPQMLRLLMQQGITRLICGEKVMLVEEMAEEDMRKLQPSCTRMVIDRFVVGHDEDAVTRYSDSVQTAFTLGHGECWIISGEEKNQSVSEHFSDRFEADGISFEEPSELMFSFNSPVGACPVCEGYGSIIGIDENLVVPDKGLSVYEDAIACWKGEKMKRWKERLILQADKFGFPIHKPYYQLTEEQKKVLWEGNKYFPGINAFFKHVEEKKYKIQYRVLLSRYRGRTVCPECHGTRLKKQAEWVKIGGKSIPELVQLPLKEVTAFFRSLRLTAHERQISARLLEEIMSRLQYLEEVGLGYLTLNRLSSTLSGGESQRIRLATQLGSNLTGSLYILDEPSIGLHPRDTSLLIYVLKQLRDSGNTVLVVEHDEEIIRAADTIVDIGPGAGRLGGEIVFCGTHKELEKAKNSLTAEYITGKREIPVPARRRKWNSYIEVTGARENNLKNIDVRFPLNALTVVTGVSGSGKSSLVCDVLYPALKRMIHDSAEKIGQFGTIRGDIRAIRSVEMVDQNPIGRSSRSNPVTYIKAWDEIRKLYASQPVAEHYHLNPSHFSFNVEGGRCEECQGEGVIHIEMQFMADVTLVCESCQGKRFKEDVLEVTFQGANIHDVLEMTVDEAIAFFGKSKNSMSRRVVEKLRPLADVGLGYIKLGQSSSTLSGGESQRVKLASFLSHENAEGGTVFIFDEPTTGLHFHDIGKLLDAFQALIEHGNSIIVIEHNMEVIKCADWVIDLGPESGNEGGTIVCEGTPETVAGCEQSYTGKFLRKKLQ